MGCVIKYKGQSIPEEQFLQYLSKQITINNEYNIRKNLLEKEGYLENNINFNNKIIPQQKQQAINDSTTIDELKTLWATLTSQEKADYKSLFTERKESILNKDIKSNTLPEVPNNSLQEYTVNNQLKTTLAEFYKTLNEDEKILLKELEKNNQLKTKCN